MPIYEYECTKCGRIEEAWQKFSDKPLKTCKHCSGRLHKLISQSTFHLKGTGWYVTDYANKPGSSSPKKGGKKSGQCSASSKKSEPKD
ncbi:MAG: zinc ribbon domain-containing protein [Deltaproteobacteria bacterium]|nr:zinc ribbon domain-containing protein [Deltaproteobacteria bacterium]MBW2020068.1 zinc ribbon domain-containing protein [Deltaproteobacteria bacterium]MBW2074865.1 zinc ribbon domain-containing protein [Deltaproteobacteria bacterium]